MAGSAKVWHTISILLACGCSAGKSAQPADGHAAGDAGIARMMDAGLGHDAGAGPIKIGTDAGRDAVVATSQDAGHAGASTCGSPQIRITEIDVGANVVQNEDEAALKPLAIAAIPSGGSRVSFMGGDARIHVITLRPDDTINTAAAAASISGMDYGDLYADDKGGVLLLTRDAQGGGTLHCGEPTNLCGTTPNPPVPCYDMYLVRFDGGSETWATQLTQSSSAHPPYLNSKTDTSNVIYIWWYAHHGRIASDGTNFAAYFGAAISISQSGCVNIHQGDEMKVVGPTGTLLTGHDTFDWGCSHSGYERIVWDPGTQHFVTICKNDAPTNGKSGKLAFAPSRSLIYPIDLYYSNVGNVVLAKGGGYWLTTSDIRAGQPANMSGLADVHLLHFTTGAPDKDLTLVTDMGQNDRAPHLTSYGSSHLLAAWDSSSAPGDLTSHSAARQLHVQVLDAADGSAVSKPIDVAVLNNRYQEMKPFPDGSVAYAAPGSTSSKLKILRVLPCQ